MSDSGINANLVIADMGALEFGGVELMKRCQPRGIPVVIFTGYQDPTHKAKALALGVQEFVSKPSTLDEYTDVLWKMITKWTAEDGRYMPAECVEKSNC